MVIVGREGRAANENDRAAGGREPATAQPDRTTHPLVYKNMIVLFAVVICCFTAWGIAADITNLMVAAFKRIFTMSTFQASLVQLAYFALTLPAACSGCCDRRSGRCKVG